MPLYSLVVQADEMVDFDDLPGLDPHQRLTWLGSATRQDHDD
ncbi:hypothetical protein [Nocardia sp. NPDC057440]